MIKDTDKKKEAMTRIEMRISKEDKAIIEQKARKTGLTTSEFIRRSALGRRLLCYGDISILESTVEEVAVMEPVIERPLTIGERAKEISTVIRNDYGRYDNVPVKVKAELFQFSVDDFEADMKLHSLMLKELNVRMYSSELYDDYMSIVDATDKKKLGELQKVDQYSKAKRWNQSR